MSMAAEILPTERRWIILLFWMKKEMEEEAVLLLTLRFLCFQGFREDIPVDSGRKAAILFV